ncbi:MAG TPA: carboxypeptidase regulatory-like domain-containing protein, partial [Polyangiaceae bacterium]|nr:carboxypeptidase regulatory-like domain-containing protein [Polyangiaceae bacterium]
LPGVRIVVRAPTLEGDGVVLSTESDERGRFAFELDKRPEAAELCATSRSHSEERRPLPPAGTLRIALVTRRRAVLRRLVSWARVRGVPYDQAPEPTPGHVRGVADRDEVRTWASGVEHAAFGPDEVDEGMETELRDREPGPN